MVGQSHRVQIRHILVDKEDVANIIKDIIIMAKTHKDQVKKLMELAPKYSFCKSKNNGGNLGWLEIASDDPRKINYKPVFENMELEKIIRDSIEKRTLVKNKVFGPVKTVQGYHLVMISNQFGETLHDTF